MQPGETVGFRGPVGIGWPVAAAYGKDVVVVTGGTGLAPLRPLVDALIAERERFGQVRLYYGARTREAVAFVCGPERMMEATTIALAGHGVTRDRIYVTLERHMECGLGFCGHCQMGRFFICKDGPVFQLSELGDLFGREGI